jgi:hypothetical protein
MAEAPGPARPAAASPLNPRRGRCFRVSFAVMPVHNTKPNSRPGAQREAVAPGDGLYGTSPWLEPLVRCVPRPHRRQTRAGAAVSAFHLLSHQCTALSQNLDLTCRARQWGWVTASAGHPHGGSPWSGACPGRIAAKPAPGPLRWLRHWTTPCLTHCDAATFHVMNLLNIM